MEESDRVRMTSTSDGVYTLRLSDLTEEDSGQYTIKAVNDAGQTSCTAQLLVHGLTLNFTVKFQRKHRERERRIREGYEKYVIFSQ